MTEPELDAVFDPDFGEWQEADGVWFRRAARVIVVDGAGKLLLLRGIDPAEPSRAWWITPGGGLEPGEEPRFGAARELFEETGLTVAPAALTGPVVSRTASFPFLGRQCRQDEVLFFTRLSGGAEMRTDGWTAVERASVTDLRWWTLDDLASATETIYPPALPEIVRPLLASGWDGITHTVD